MRRVQVACCQNMCTCGPCQHRRFRPRTPTLICHFKVSAVQRKWMFPRYSRHWKRMCPIYWWQRSTINHSKMCMTQGPTNAG